MGKVRDGAIAFWSRPMLTGPIVIGAHFVQPRPSREYHEKDLDKLTRAVLDALQAPAGKRYAGAGVFADDKQVKALFAASSQVDAANPIPGAMLWAGPLTDAAAIADEFFARIGQTARARLAAVAAPM